MTRDPLVVWHEALAQGGARLETLTWGDSNGTVFDSYHPRELTIAGRRWVRAGWYLWADGFTRGVPLVNGQNRNRRAPEHVVDDLMRGESSITLDINISPAPWSRSDWHGSLIAVGDPRTDIDDVTRADVLHLVCWRGSDDRYEGDTAGVAQLRNHVFIAWEASYGPTGDGFNHDAYGGNADIFYGTTPWTAASALSQYALELLAEWWVPCP